MRDILRSPVSTWLEIVAVEFFIKLVVTYHPL